MKVEHININAYVDVNGIETGVVGAVVPITLIPSAGHNKIRTLKTVLVSATSNTAPTVSLGLHFGQVYDPPIFVDEYTTPPRPEEDYSNGSNEEEEDKPRSNTEAGKRGLREDADSLKTDSRFYLIKDTEIPIGAAVDITAGFPNGIPFLSSYSLFIVLGGSGQSVSLILAYE
jgi:hypothetical protein